MMITKNIRIFAPALLVIITSCSQQPAQTANTDEAPSITFRERPDQKRIDVLVDGNLFTSYQWPEGVYKPVLYPILTPSGTPVTRGFPLEPREGESEDHRNEGDPFHTWY